jgi:hypothetical protein
MSRGRRNGTVQVLALGTTFGLELRNEVQPPFQHDGECRLLKSSRREGRDYAFSGSVSLPELRCPCLRTPYPTLESETPDDSTHWRKACPLSYVCAFRRLHESD